MKTIRLILCDHLNIDLSSLSDYNKKTDIVFMCEVLEEFTYVKHHKKKILFLMSAMRHFAKELTNKGFSVHYVKLDDKSNTQSLKKEITKIAKKYNIKKVILTTPNRYKLLKDILKWRSDLNIEVEVKPDEGFLCPIEEFKQWSKARKVLRMEHFYHFIRRKHDILMDNGEPVGNKWNFDQENRKTPSDKLPIPGPYKSKIDSITKSLIPIIAEKFNNHFGDVEPFHFAVTRKEALKALDVFINKRLKYFGDYQDAMLENEPWMFHSHLSLYINCGLLNPLECIKKAEKAYYDKKAPINAVEGFIRQLLGWREYIRGIYWLKMPSYKKDNFLNANRKLPYFYWTGETKMNCLKQCIKETKENAYAHHIQRLMVLGNFALLAGLDPKEVNEWYLIVYADAYEWVELPNVTGMILFADGGFLGSKPYAASGAYINKMSNYCQNCPFDVNQKHGSKACPFNYLYWDFLIRNRKKLQHVQRLKMIYSIIDKMTAEKINEIKKSTKIFFGSIK